jgi:hypothetical protein
VNVVDRVIRTAKEFVGVREEPGNRGPVCDFANWYIIKDWHDYPVGGRGAPWCSTFLQLVGRLSLGDAWPFPREAMMSSVQLLTMWAIKKGLTVEVPAPGDFLCVSRGEGWGHIALVTEALSDNTVKTIEGNTNEGGSFDGVGVFVRTRQVRPTDRLVRWTDLLPGVGPLG